MAMNVKQVVSLLFSIPVLTLFSCGEKSDSGCCVFTNLGRDADLEDDQGLLQVQGSTAAYFYALDETGKQIGYQSLNQPLALEEGKYQVKVNNSVYPVEVKSGKLATCSTGTLIVAGNTSDYYYVTDKNNQQLGYELLGKPMSLFPGSFKVKVNNTEKAVSIGLKEMTEVRSGTLLVHGTTNEYYYVLDSANKQLNYNTLEKPLAFLEGSYPVKVNNTTLRADITGGRLTELPTGTLLVRGLTDEYYYVSDTSGHALNYQVLNKPLALFPGRVHVKINNTRSVADIAAADTTEFLTGSLMLTGAGTQYYYVLDDTGKSLNYNSLNKSLSFFPSEYTVKLGESTRKAIVIPGQLTSIDAFR